MSITNKLTAGLVSVVVVFAVATVSSVPAVHAQDDGLADLLRMLQETQSQLSALDGTGSTATTPTVTSVTSSACPYTWTRNLSMGSTGDDVRQLQQFLNGNPQTVVASTGAGSPGNETKYYGPATARAVSKFQEVYASAILTPLGLTKGTGGFYSSTRNHANSMCQTDSSSGVAVTGPSDQSPVVQVAGDALAVTPGSQIGDGFAVLGAQRVPYTSFVLTAGNDSVRLEGVLVKQFGLSDPDNFESVALVDVNGVQIGSARSLNSRDEARLGGNFIIPRNRSVTLAVVGNIAVGADVEASGVAGLEIVSVDADARVQGSFPIRGAAHAYSDAITLQKVNIEVTAGDDEVPFNEDTEVAAFTIELDTSGDIDEEDSYLKSIIFDQRGSADEDELGQIMFYIDGDRVEHSLVVDGDKYIVTFTGRGVLIEEGESVEVSIEINTNRGYEEDIQFAIDDKSDVYVVGASYGYGLPVIFDNNANSNEIAVGDNDVSTITSGEISDGNIRGSEFDDEVQYGRNVVVAAHAFEFEGEDVDMQGLTFDVMLEDFNADSTEGMWAMADEDSVTLDNIRLVVDGQVVGYGDLLDSNGNQAEFDQPTGGASSIDLEIEFEDEFTIDVRDSREVLFEIMVNLDEAWGSFDGASLDFELSDVEEAMGRNSEKDYTAVGRNGESNGHFYLPAGTAIEFEGVEIVGNEVTFEVTDGNVDETNFVAGSEDIVFGTLEVDASEAVDDVRIKNLWVSFRTTGTSSITGDLDHLQDCAVYDESDDRVTDGRVSLSGESSSTTPYQATDRIRFRFERGTVVESGEEADFQVRCDLDSDATSNAQFNLITLGSGADRSTLEYEINDNEFDHDFEAFASDLITVSASGSLVVEVNHPDDDRTLYAEPVGNRGSDDVDLIEIEIEAEEEDIRITDIYLADVKLAANTVANATRDHIDELLDAVRVNISNKTLRPRDFKVGDITTITGESDTQVNYFRFKNLSETIEVGRSGTRTFTLSADFGGISENKGKSGRWLDSDTSETKLFIVWEGVTSDTDGYTEIDVDDNLTKVRVFPTVPTVSAESTNQNISDGDEKKVYEFSVRASEEGDVYLKQVAVNFTRSSGVSLTNVKVRRGVSSRSSEVGTITNVTTDGLKKSTFGDVEVIDAGETVVYSIWATIAGLSDDKTLSVDLAADTAVPAAGAEIGRDYSTGLGNFVWSPNSLGNRASIAGSGGNSDWFNGYAVFTNDDAGSWNSSRS